MIHPTEDRGLYRTKSLAAIALSRPVREIQSVTPLPDDDWVAICFNTNEPPIVLIITKLMCAFVEARIERSAGLRVSESGGGYLVANSDKGSHYFVKEGGCGCRDFRSQVVHGRRYPLCKHSAAVDAFLNQVSLMESITPEVSAQAARDLGF